MDSQGETTYKESISEAQKILKGKKENFARLQREVINTGACCSCGACVASCDQLGFEDGKPKLVGKCTVCGVCYSQCPQTSTIASQLIGNCLGVFTGKSRRGDVKGQDGGVVTSLLLYALDKKMIDAAVVTRQKSEQPWKPEADVVTSNKEIIESSGSVYSHSQVVPALAKAIKGGHKSIAFVGTPCKIDAAYKMQNSLVGLVHLSKGINVVRLGLFCMDSFSPNGLRTFFEEKNSIPLADIVKMNIKEGKFRVTRKTGEEKEFPIPDLDSYRSSSCDFCTDFTSEKADISVGSVGSQPGFSTIIVRTNAGLELLNEAAGKGYIEFKPLNDEDLTKVLNLARTKKNHRYSPREKQLHMLNLPPSKLEGFLASETQPAKPLIKLVGTELSGEGASRVRATLRNDSVDSLEDVKVTIAHRAEAPSNVVGWKVPVSEWLPSQQIAFDYQRVKDEKEYIIEVESEEGDKIFTKKMTTADLMKK
ncbi:MAG: Coenzyme F420 hydrogenase/dehydrogenase, beta subunit C-terminal domain [Promethearchaeati archaeon SRVP18_Atabeyarchaeia-1]